MVPYPGNVRALYAFASLLSTALLGPALAETMALSLPGAIAALAASLGARALVPLARKLQSEDPPREAR